MKTWTGFILVLAIALISNSTLVLASHHSTKLEPFRKFELEMNPKGQWDIFLDSAALKFAKNGTGYTIHGTTLVSINVETNEIKKVQLALLDGKPFGDMSFDLSPDGKKIAIDSRMSSKAGIYRIDNGQLETSFDHGVPVARIVRFTPDGSQVWLGSQGKAERRDIRTGKLIEELGTRNFQVNTHDIVLARDGSTLAMVQEGSIEVFKTGEHLPHQTIAIKPASPIAHFNGSLIAFISPENQLEVWDLRAGIKRAQSAAGPGTPVSLMFSDDGTVLHSVSNEGGYKVWKITETPKTTRQIAPAYLSSGTLSPDHRYFISRGKEILAWPLAEKTASELNPRAGTYDLGGPCLGPSDPDYGGMSTALKQLYDEMRLANEAHDSKHASEIQAKISDHIRNSPEIKAFALESAAKKANDWPKVLEYRKTSVRTQCHIAYRWVKLAEVLVRLGKAQDAIEVLKDAHSRGAELDLHGQGIIGTFIASAEFKKTEFGKQFWGPIAAAESLKPSFLTTIKNLPAHLRPPAIYIAEGACPFECCTFREWNVEKDVDLYDKPSGTQLVAHLKAGESVTGLTGEVHVKPKAAGVVRNFQSGPINLKKGDVFFVLDYLGEGAFRFWVNGETTTALSEPAEVCPENSTDCWAQYVEPKAGKTDPDHVWWVKVKTKLGQTGWTKESSSFGNKDACG